VTPDHYDALAVLAVGVALIIAVEMRLRALFSRHESREQAMHAESQLAASGAVAAATMATRNVEAIRAEVAEQRMNVANLSELVRVQEARLIAVEVRLARALVAVPHPPHGDP
jgi:hypothetical protein